MTKELITQFTEAPEETLFSTTDIAHVLGVSTAKLEFDRHLGRGLPYYRVGRFCRYKKSDVLKWLEQQKISPDRS